jgi:hypothetical protein
LTVSHKHGDTKTKNNYEILFIYCQFKHFMFLAFLQYTHNTCMNYKHFLRGETYKYTTDAASIYLEKWMYRTNTRINEKAPIN